MKIANDPRHKKRAAIIKKLYEFSFRQSDKIPLLIQPIIKNIKSIDKIISKNAPEWPINKLNKIDLAILRLAIFEMKIKKKNPFKVIIDEAVELAKEYGAQNSPKFINGVLGAIVKK